VLQGETVPLTCFTQMSQAARYFDQLNALAALAEVEFAVHSYSHDTHNPASPDEVRRGWETFADLWNAAPLGYRAPNCLIDERGIDTLTRQGFAYDSSIVPALRVDRYAYNNLQYGRDPFRFDGPSGTIIEYPVACLRGVRLPFIFSYIKLFGLAMYEAAMRACPLPETVVLYLHPYDLYIDAVSPHLTGWKRQAHLRNARRAPQLLLDVIALLKRLDYTFVRMGELAANVSFDGRVRTLALEPSGHK
jgi:hypothetical protein